MLKTRILAALVFTPACFGLVWWGGWPLRLMCLALVLLMLWECMSLLLGTDYLSEKIATMALGNLWAWQVMGLELPIPAEGLLACTLIVLLLLALVEPEPVSTAMVRTAFLAFSLIYASSLLPFLARLREMDHGLGWAMLALFGTWAADTSAYFAGRAMGKHLLAPSISPKKTVEGALGGWLGAIGVAWLANGLFDLSLSWWLIILLGTLVALVGLMGDLAESLLKRSVGAKDSGRFLPGHGGVLDRFDGVMFVAPIIFLFVYVLG